MSQWLEQVIDNAQDVSDFLSSQRKKSLACLLYTSDAADE